MDGNCPHCKEYDIPEEVVMEESNDRFSPDLVELADRHQREEYAKTIVIEGHMFNCCPKCAKQIDEIHSAFMALTNGLAELQNNPPPGPMGMLMKMFVGGMQLPKGGVDSDGYRD